MARYRKKHSDAWRYLLEILAPDVAFVQEAMISTDPTATYGGQLFWSEDCGSDSGTAIWVRDGLCVENVSIRSKGSYLAAVQLPISGAPTQMVSVHVGGPNYRQHLRILTDELEQHLRGKRFVVAGDLNAARHLDNVQGGKWFTRFFEDLDRRNFCDCHWKQHGGEIQSFWGHQAKNPYQCDHAFTDPSSSGQVSSCHILPYDPVREFSDHSPLLLVLHDNDGLTLIRPPVVKGKKDR